MQIFKKIKSFFQSIGPFFKKLYQEDMQRHKAFAANMKAHPRRLIALIGGLIAFVGLIVVIIVLAVSNPGGGNTSSSASSAATSSVMTTSSEIDDTLPNYGPIDMETVDTSAEMKKWKKVNEDFVGILEIEELGMKEVVVKAKDHEEYVRKNIYKKYDKLGVLFFDLRTPFDFNSGFGSQNTLIYGHNVGKYKYDDRKFGKLMKYRDIESKTYETADVIKFTSYSGIVFYFKVFSGYAATDNPGTGKNYDNNYYMTTSFATNKLYPVDDPRHFEAYQKFIDKILERSEFDAGVDVTVYDRILSLSTCTYDSETYNRYVIHARLMRPSEVKAQIAEEITGSEVVTSKAVSSTASSASSGAVTSSKATSAATSSKATSSK